MDWWHQVQAETFKGLERSGLPKRVIRYLLESPGMAVGNSILDAGCGGGELSWYLACLGFQVTGFDECPEHIAAARRSTPRADFSCGASLSLPFPQHRFDLVLVRGLNVYGGSLYSLGSLQTTAQLLSCVKPGGRLVILEHRDTTASGVAEGHGEECLSKHLDGFAGNVSAVDLQDPMIQPGVLKTWLMRKPRAGYVAATIEIPEEPIERSEWLRMAEVRVFLRQNSCCQWADQFRRQTSRRAAA
jgi:SAM-dependent methyltransferase